MIVTAIVAYNANFVIGDTVGNVPWRLKDDIKFFKETTMGHPVVMGRATWDSIPQKFKPLPGRHNVVVSRNFHKFVFPKVPDAMKLITVLPSVEESIEEAAKKDGGEEVFVIGGGQIYHYCVEHGLLDRVLASEVKGHLDVEAAAHFADLRSLGWSHQLLQEFPDFNVVEFVPSK